MQYSLQDKRFNITSEMMLGGMLHLTHHFESGLTSEFAEPVWVSVPPCCRAVSGGHISVFITTCSCIPVEEASKGDEPGEVGGIAVC